MAIKMISVDMDGTILDNDKRVRPRVIEAAKRAMDLGALFVLNSGRMPESMTSYAALFPVNAPMICYNGALTWDEAKKEQVDAVTLPADAAREILRAIEEAGVYAQAFWGNCYYYERFTEYSAAYAAKCKVDGRATGEKLSGMLPGDVYKLLMIGRPGEAAALIPSLTKRFGDVASFAASSATFVEVVNRKADKGTALLRLGARCGIAPDEILAFGDEQNDLPMIEAAGHGYAMGNASDAVKSRARFVAPSNMEDGVARVIEGYIARGEMGVKA